MTHFLDDLIKKEKEFEATLEKAVTKSIGASFSGLVESLREKTWYKIVDGEYSCNLGPLNANLFLHGEFGGHSLKISMERRQIKLFRGPEIKDFYHFIEQKVLEDQRPKL